LSYAKLHYKLLACVLCLGALYLATNPLQIIARSAADVAAEIEQQKKAQAELEKQLAGADKALQAAKADLGKATGQIPALEAQIREIEANITYNQLKLKTLTESKQLRTLQQRAAQMAKDSVLRTSYLDWRSESAFKAYTSRTGAHPLQREVYRSQILAETSQDLNGIVAEIDKINDDIVVATKLTADLSTQNTQLKARKAQLEAEIASLRRAYNSRNSHVSGLRSQVTTIQRNINMLSAEQRALQEYEDSLTRNGGNGGSQPVQPGQYYLFGKGRDL
jgi:predicted  nucleic acid-binding Zn-ribbon protein